MVLQTYFPKIILITSLKRLLIQYTLVVIYSKLVSLSSCAGTVVHSNIFTPANSTEPV